MNSKSQPEVVSGWLFWFAYIQAAPTMIKRINNTTIKAKPPPYP